METLSAEGPNADQIEFWNSEPGLKWVRHQERMDRTLAPVTARLMELARPAPGERVLDIGCGCGATTFEAAQRVGPSGHVTGIDISAPMLAHAEHRKGARGGPEFLLMDAASARFPDGHYDLALSRFGVMFFSDPAAAFANIRSALKPGGRLVFACWQAMPASPWFTIPIQTAMTQLPPQAPPDPQAPGPFAFADAARVETILRSAGFSGIAVTPATLPLMLAEAGADLLEDAARFALDMGPASRLLQDASEAQRASVRTALRLALEPYVTAKGILLDGAIWLVEARARAA